jgi:hypothetical protein
VSSTTYRVSHLSDARQFATSLNIARRKTDPLDLSDDQETLLIDRNGALTGNFDVSGFYTVGAIQVVGPRSTGWTADTGTAEKGAHATYPAGSTLTFTDPPTAAEMTALATRIAAIEAAVQGATRGQKALKDLALGHGFAGT